MLGGVDSSATGTSRPVQMTLCGESRGESFAAITGSGAGSGSGKTCGLRVRRPDGESLSERTCTSTPFTVIPSGDPLPSAAAAFRRMLLGRTALCGEGEEGVSYTSARNKFAFFCGAAGEGASYTSVHNT